MSETSARHGFAHYLRIWGVLLAITMVMIAIDQAELRLALIAGVLLTAMLIKASLIAAYFMHLRLEGRLLVWSVAVGLLGLGLILYILLVPDGLRIHDMVTAP